MNVGVYIAFWQIDLWEAITQYAWAEAHPTFTGFKSNYFNIESGDFFWISGPRKDQSDRLYCGNKDFFIDEDIREEYRLLVG